MNEKKSLILMVEDEEQVLNTNCRMLQRRGYDVRTAQTVSEVCHQLEEQLPDLLILDIMLPDGNGLDICRHFREKTMNPVLFLTGKSDIRDKVEGLQQGGDYYLTKPYNFDEFLAVIQMLLERQKRMEEKIKEKFQSSRQITIGSLRLDLSDGHAYLNNADTGLTRTEFSLLRLLAENQEKIFSAKELYEAVWGSCAGTDTSTVRRHIFNLRTKIGAEDTDEYDIVSVYGKGYLFYLPISRPFHDRITYFQTCTQLSVNVSFSHISGYRDLSVTMYLTDRSFYL